MAKWPNGPNHGVYHGFRDISYIQLLCKSEGKINMMYVYLLYDMAKKPHTGYRMKNAPKSQSRK